MVKSHSKSHHGCRRCRQRKVKVLMRHFSMAQLGQLLMLVYSATRPFRVASGALDVAASAMAPLIRVPTWEPWTCTIEPAKSHLLDLDLVHSFVATTHSTLWSRSEGQLLWRDSIFREALQQPFLMNGILAISAMHRLFMGPRTPSPTATTLAKQGALLRGLLALLSSENDESCLAAFPLAIIVSLWAFASKNLPPEFNIISANTNPQSTQTTHQGGFVSTSYLDQFLDLIKLIQPVDAIVQKRLPRLLNGMYSELMRVPDPGQLPELSKDTSNALERLKSHLQQHEEELANMVDSTSYASLSNMFRLASCPEWSELIVGWAIQLPAPFVTRLRNRDHAALVLLSYWAVCFSVLDGRWWAAGWSKALQSEINCVVKDEWSHLLDWPNSCFEIQRWPSSPDIQSKTPPAG
ncbi:hypothetical protein PFICI_11285 [Pestalotiopsis fici W106-1]|uniref:Transcription factor domain-containing protein n=1 Tax=Pestalotiopsis fici (strain W106-1 / CGMCC3.15140) TaxID=1229662 RepID=W3WX15_PESFW|nr:uncharacterized protein PFICI_11285 [Pestalotiopsis fici W106-1]ETS77411.1 hypothetical protein PFICI_11285 [Pestalotiopsis fici W106-1]